jgi:NADPH2 dehydrogenase
LFLFQQHSLRYKEDMKALSRHSPLPLAPGKVLRNRVVVPAMASDTADEAGFVTEKTRAHYAKLAESGAGLIFAEYTFVHPSGRSEDRQLGISSDAHLEGLKDLSRVMRSHGALVGIQLTHAGGKTERSLTGGALMAPSAVAVPVKDREMEVPAPMTRGDIDLWVDSFVSAARRAERAGFDLVELHSAHGYGLNQWISPYTNRRQDEYGQTLEGRMKILKRIIRGIQSACPHLLLSVRIPGADFVEGGLSDAEVLLLARDLERMGVSILNVSSGIGGWRRPRDRSGQGYLLPEAERIQRVVKIPVIGVGGIHDGSFIDERLRAGDISLAAVGRAILENPGDWGKKNLGNLTSELAS